VKFTGVLAEIGNKTRGTLSLDDAASEVKSINKKQVRIILIICNSFGQTTVLNLFKNWIDVKPVSVFRFCFCDWPRLALRLCDASDSADAMHSSKDDSASLLFSYRFFT
jgi:hypothetical protein